MFTTYYYPTKLPNVHYDTERIVDQPDSSITCLFWHLLIFVYALVLSSLVSDVTGHIQEWWRLRQEERNTGCANMLSYKVW